MYSIQLFAIATLRPRRLQGGAKLVLVLALVPEQVLLVPSTLAP
jgi:hypothetical protein